MKKKKYPTNEEAAIKVVDDLFVALARKKLKAEISSLTDEKMSLKHTMYRVLGMVHVTSRATVILAQDICLTLVASYSSDIDGRRVECAATLAVFKGGRIFCPIDSVSFWIPQEADMRRISKRVVRHMLDKSMEKALDARKGLRIALTEAKKKGRELKSFSAAYP